MAVRDLPSTGRAWGFPSVSRYWMMKESNSPSGTVQERPTESWVMLEAESTPRLGRAGATVGASSSSSCGAVAAMRKKA